jgi:predicted DCC family thiol-disulfide oxidoreductase YuxK
MTQWAHAVGRWWHHFWFEPTGASNLGIARLLFYAGIFMVYVQEDFAGWADVSKAYWAPVWVFSVLSLDVYPAPVLRAIELAFLGSLALAAVGLFTRAATTVAAVLGLYYFGLPHNYGHVYHFDALIVFVLIVMALARTADAWSLDRLVKLARGRATPVANRSPEYTWPSRMVWVLMALILSAAGASKLRHSGLDWIFTDTLSIFLIRAQYHVSDADPWIPWGLWIAQHKPAVTALAAMTIVVEFLFPLALVFPATRWFFVPGAFAMLLGIRALMGPTFGVFLMANVFWIRWDVVASWMRSRVQGPAKATVLYDGDCGLCTRTVAVLRSLDLRGRVTFFDIWRDWPAIQARFPALPQPALAADMHVISDDGRVFKGFDGYRALMWVLPLGWLALPLLYLPGVRPVGARVYRAVADNRTTAGCAVNPQAGKPAQPV